VYKEKDSSMRYLLVVGLFIGFAGSGFAADRRAVYQQKPAASSMRMSVNVGTPQAPAAAQPTQQAAPVTAPTPPPPPVDDRAAERQACENGNGGGAGNVFVWADKNSLGTEYAGMIESKTPADNACFVRVDITSTDSKVDLSGIKSKYFKLGSNIKCGSWVNEDQVKSRILDASKSTRTWATVGGVVGGIGVGVGAMELFGNKLIGGKVQGQKALAPGSAELLYSQMTPDERASYAAELKKMKDACGAFKEGDNPPSNITDKCKDVESKLLVFGKESVPAKKS
jgi:hypothetical protein